MLVTQPACFSRFVAAHAVLVVLGMSGCGSAGDGSDSDSTATTAGTTAVTTTTQTATDVIPTTGEPTGEPTGATTTDTTAGDTTGPGEDLDMTAEDFTCILDWAKARKFRITNLLGHTEEAIAVANNPEGGVYPVGTVIQLIPNEAMVKRRAGFAPDNSDWEFFALSTSANGTTIMDRGTTDVVNGLGGNCFACHAKAEPQWDRVCDEGRGCDPLPFTPEQIEMVQNGDPRCP